LSSAEDIPVLINKMTWSSLNKWSCWTRSKVIQK